MIDSSAPTLVLPVESQLGSRGWIDGDFSSEFPFLSDALDKHACISNRPYKMFSSPLHDEKSVFVISVCPEAYGPWCPGLVSAGLHELRGECDLMRSCRARVDDPSTGNGPLVSVPVFKDGMTFSLSASLILEEFWDCWYPVEICLPEWVPAERFRWWFMRRFIRHAAMAEYMPDYVRSAVSGLLKIMPSHVEEPDEMRLSWESSFFMNRVSPQKPAEEKG